MAVRQYILPFTLGVTVGVVVTQNWPTIRKVVRPLLRGAMKSGTEIVEKSREVYHAQSEKFTDLIAEIREEEEAKAKAEKAPSPPKEPAPA